jgi:hypothetical protein
LSSHRGSLAIDARWRARLAKRRRERVKRRPLVAHRRPPLRGRQRVRPEVAVPMPGSATKQSNPAHSAGLLAGARNDEAFSRRVRTRVLLPRKTKSSDPIPSDGAGGTGIHLDRAWRMKSGRRNADRRVCPTSAPATFILPPLAGKGRGGGAARVQRDALACRRSTAALAAANQRRRSAPARASWDAAFAGVSCISPVPVQRASRRPVMVPAGRFPGAARGRR